MSSEYQKTNLWKKTLSAQEDDEYSELRENLRDSYLSVRHHAQILAETIQRNFPEFTIHNITHSDALWSYTDLIIGKDYQINPCEAYVMGCAFLIHDLGMSLAAYPDGLIELKRLEIWNDTIVNILKNSGKDNCNINDIENASSDIQQLALIEVLRTIHAQQSEKLLNIYWENNNNHERYYLIENSHLRNCLGATIGRIAHSHWQSLSTVAYTFQQMTFTLPGFPSIWPIDSLKVACILRVADFAHIDNTRAPNYLYALIKPKEKSSDHWVFQSKISSPVMINDRLVYTSLSDFDTNEIKAWWICYDILNQINNELSQVDSLLSDYNRERFIVKGVSNVEDPLRLAQLVKVKNWKPVETKIKASDVTTLVSKLGGYQLYDNDFSAPLRELIQNAADAIRARRILEEIQDYGIIKISHGIDSSGHWIQIEDNGVGMSEEVITGSLLDFGSSLWNSFYLQSEFPGLLSSAFKSTGKYGIGFYSVFMWSSNIEVTTQRYDKSRDSTLVLSFNEGLQGRPVLRNAEKDEYIKGGGTRIKILIKNKDIFLGICNQYRDSDTLSQVAARIAPTLDIDLFVNENNVIKANDWQSVSDKELLRRIFTYRPYYIDLLSEHDFDIQLDKLPKLRDIKNSEEQIIGRAALYYNLNGLLSRYTLGAITEDGIFGSQMRNGIIGILQGKTIRPSRDHAIPSIPKDSLYDWVEKERDLSINNDADLYTDARFHDQIRYAELIYSFGIKPFKLPVANSINGWMNLDDIEKKAKLIDHAKILSSSSEFDILGNEYSENDFVVRNDVFYGMMMFNDNFYGMMFSDKKIWPPIKDQEKWGKYIAIGRSIIGLIIECFADAWSVNIMDVIRESDLNEKVRDVDRYTEICISFSRPIICL